MKLNGIFFIIMIFIVLLANTYVFYSLQKTIPLKFVKIIFLSAQILSFLMFVVSFLFRESLNPTLTNIFFKIGTTYVFIFLYLIVICAIKDIICLTPLTFKKYLTSNWYCFAGIFIFITTLFSIGYVNYLHKKRVEITINITKTMNADKTLKIVGISDLHLGYNINKKEFSEWVETINNENPDLIIIAGDIIDNSVKPLFEQNFAEVFKKFKTKFGIYAVLGNHDYHCKYADVKRFFADADITLLQDSVALINNNFYIIGRDDKTNRKRLNIRELCNNLDTTKLTILLDHQPFNLNEAEENHIDFQFSGHTHNGQLYPIKWLTDFMYEKSYGFLKKGETSFYISSGIGIWGGKYRLGSKSEYVVIQLKQ